VLRSLDRLAAQWERVDSVSNFRSIFSFERAGNFSLSGGHAASAVEKLAAATRTAQPDRFKLRGFLYDEHPIPVNTSSRYTVLGFLEDPPGSPYRFAFARVGNVGAGLALPSEGEGSRPRTKESRTLVAGADWTA